MTKEQLTRTRDDAEAFIRAGLDERSGGQGGLEERKLEELITKMKNDESIPIVIPLDVIAPTHEVNALESQLAESQAREAQIRSLLYRHYFSIGMITLCGPCNELNKETTESFMNDAKRELSLPAPDLVGMIKTLSAALEQAKDPAQFHGNIINSECSCVVCCALSSTREIRERIGAT